MAESFDDNLKERREGGKQTSISLLIPWSCREGFTNEVCGLPGNVHGCWRYRETAENANIEESQKGIKPCREDSVEPLVAWIVFESPVGDDGIEARAERSRPFFRSSHHQALFGFTQKGFAAFLEQSESGYYPNYVEYSRAVPGSDERVAIKGWLGERGDELGLSDCFGHYAFVPQQVKSETLQLSPERKFSLSDLIRSYLNHNPGCTFRKDGAERGVGITVCKVGVGLSKTPVIGQVPTNGGTLDLLSTSAISFSYVDTETLSIKKFSQWSIGEHDRGVSEELRSVSDTYFVPLSVRFLSGRSGENDINFATSLSQRGRQNVLPSEAGKSFLSFPVGEISSYLLQWMLLRVFADDSTQNSDFIKLFDQWRKLVKNGRPATQAFANLLASPVTLPIDTNVFKEDAIKLERKEQYLGIYDTPVSFGESLGVLGLSSGEHDTWIHTTCEFLTRFFKPALPNQDFRKLPMYRDLRWGKSELLDEALESSDKTAQLEGIVACLANASGLSTEGDSKGIAQAELREHNRRCVFPIADVLSNLPFEVKMPLYYIFPLWEDTIRDDLGKEWRGPVVFAHVFTRALHSRSNDALPSSKEIIKTGEHLQSALLPAGAAIAHDFYKKLLAQKSAWSHARAWAHEVKNYTSPVIDDLGSPMLRKQKTVTSADARQNIERSRRGVLILNAVSKAVQLSLNSKVNSGDVKQSEGDLIRVSRFGGQEIVELALQYLLSYRHEFLESSSVRKYTIDWRPRLTTSQTLERLCELLQGSEKDVVTNVRVIGLLALIREAVWNIRNEAPHIVNGQLPIINISYEFTTEQNLLTLVLTQEQDETNEGGDREFSPGIRLANALFGRQGAEFGSIEELPRAPAVMHGTRHFSITRKVKIEFDLAD